MASSEFEHDTLTIHKRGQKRIHFDLAYVFPKKSILKSENSSLGKIIQQVVQILLRLRVAKLSKVRKLNVEK